MNTLPAPAVCTLDTAPSPSFILPPDAEACKPCSQASHYTTLGFSPAQGKRARLNPSKPSESNSSGARRLEAHRRLIQKSEKSCNGPASPFSRWHRGPGVRPSRSPTARSPGNSPGDGCPSLVLGRLFEKPGFPLRGTQGRGPAPALSLRGLRAP